MTKLVPWVKPSPMNREENTQSLSDMFWKL